VVKGIPRSVPFNLLSPSLCIPVVCPVYGQLQCMNATFGAYVKINRRCCNSLHCFSTAEGAFVLSRCIHNAVDTRKRREASRPPDPPWDIWRR